MTFVVEFESKERLFWFVISVPFYFTNSTITQPIHQPSSLRLYIKLLFPNNTNAMSLSLFTVEALGAHWRHHVDVFNNIEFPSYLIINMRLPSNVKL
jgi:hypothetical protein